MPDSRLNKRIFHFAIRSSSNSCKNWSFRIKKHLNKCQAFQDPDQAISKRNMIVQVTNTMNNNFNVKWFQIISSECGVSGRGGNKK